MKRIKMTKIAEATLWLPGFAPEELEAATQAAVEQKELPPVVAIKSAEIIQLPTAFFAEAFAAKQTAKTEKAKEVWEQITPDTLANLEGLVSKYRANVRALKLLAEFNRDQRHPTSEEREALSRYTGWGGLPEIFGEDFSRKPEWQAKAEELKSLLTDSEWNSARASVNNAHFTPVEIIGAVWKAVQRLGFKGGRILEPAAGAGYFLGAMPKEIAESSEITAVEIDSISASILESLYGPYGVKVLRSGLEATKLPEGWFDLAISNVPFGNYKVADISAKPYANHLIHDWFFFKGLDLVRPGGLVAFITSTGTMDKFDTRVRAGLAAQADLVGAIRLPAKTFASVAHTDTAADIIILRKRVKGESQGPADWVEYGSIAPESLVGETRYGKTHTINPYFATKPEMVIGSLAWRSNGFQLASTPVFDGDLNQALSDRITALPENVYAPVARRDREGAKKEKLTVLMDDDQGFKPGSFHLKDGHLVVAEDGHLRMLDKEVNATAAARIRGMIAIRDAARDLIRTQATTTDDAKLTSYQFALNATYDLFVAKHGPIHARANRLAFRGDPDLPLLLSLEFFDSETERTEKADIFFRRTVNAVRRIDSCDNAGEALVVSLIEKGCVAPSFIGALVRQDPVSVMSELEADGKVFLSPATGEWETSDEYLSGNVRKKLAEAEAAGDRFARNADALRQVVPADLLPGEIDGRIGSSWIPASDYQKFLNELLDTDSAKVLFSASAGAWDVSVAHYVTTSIAATQNWGTSRSHAVELFTQALNQQVPTIKDRVSDNKYVTNPRETMAAREKQWQLREKFREWVFADADRAQRLVRLYNDEFNSVRLREYNGDHLTLPGFSQVYSLRKHQKDAAWRIVVGGNTLLAHVVGAGKTLTMIAGGMELRRLGIVNKPCYVVPNHMLHQFAAEFMRAYPGANVLMASKEDLEGDKRRTLLSRIATGNWDGIIITHASFERIRVSDDHLGNFIQAEIADLEAAIRAEGLNTGKSQRRIVRELERQKKNWTARLKKLAAHSKKDDVLTFDELGIDQLFIDEAHLFKSLFRFSKMTRVAGLPTANSERAFDMFVKTRMVMAQNDWERGVVFATGTPVANSMAELFVMQRYLQPVTLESLGMEMFDAWAGNFGESVTSLEIAPDGSGYRMNTRFSRFVNVPELMTVFREVADIKTAEMLDLPVPETEQKIVVAEASDQLREYISTLVERAEAIRNGRVRPNEDNMLAVTNDGRKAALDMRLVEPSAPMDPNGKVGKCIANVAAIWRDTKAIRGTQLVFCDLSTPNADGRFSVYQEVRSGLVDAGVPAHEIAFIHDHESDAAKETLFSAVREGRIRVLIGSTSKMGMGTNVQTRLVAMHELDIPWRPADRCQRIGRIVRQGNLNAKVSVFVYVTESSFDSYMYQILENKARFIAQVMRGDTSARSIEDVEMAALSYAEIKALASGNPLVLEKAGLDAEVAKLSMLKATWQRQQSANRYELATLPSSIADSANRVEGIRKDLETRQDVGGDNFEMMIGENTYRDRAEAGEVLMAARDRACGRDGLDRGEWVAVGNIGGFTLGVELFYDQFGRYTKFFVEGERRYYANRAETPTGHVRTIENCLTGLEERLELAVASHGRLERKLEDIRRLLDDPFEHEARLATLLTRQRELDLILDLGRNEAGGMGEDEANDVEAVAA